MNMFVSIEEEVAARVAELTPDLLPRVLERMTARDGLTECTRHARLLYPYVRAQILLSKTKRNYFEFDYEGSKAVFEHALELRNTARATYRGTPCTCWATHR